MRIEQPMALPRSRRDMLPPAYREIVDHLRQRRSALGLSQEDVGGAWGCTDGYIAKLEAGHRMATFETLSEWAETLGVAFALLPAEIPAPTRAALENRQNAA